MSRNPIQWARSEFLQRRELPLMTHLSHAPPSALADGPYRTIHTLRRHSVVAVDATFRAWRSDRIATNSRKARRVRLPPLSPQRSRLVFHWRVVTQRVGPTSPVQSRLPAGHEFLRARKPSQPHVIRDPPYANALRACAASRGARDACSGRLGVSVRHEALEVLRRHQLVGNVV